jgi:Family of unknown function (DUF6361)
MPSSFGWLDTDSYAHRDMLALLDLFNEPDVADELGISSIRDAFSNTLFPGTAYQQDEIRYVLLIPYLMRHAAEKDSPEKMSAEFLSLERQLVTSLKAGGVRSGIVGSRVQTRLASDVYWTPMVRWGIRTSNLSYIHHFRRVHQLQRQKAGGAVAGEDDDMQARELLPDSGLDPGLPPEREEVLKKTTFALTAEEREYLVERIALSTEGSVLAWLVQNPPGNRQAVKEGGAGFVWDIDNIDAVPGELRELVDHAWRFQAVIHGASLTYNLLLAEKKRLMTLTAHTGRRWPASSSPSSTIGGPKSSARLECSTGGALPGGRTFEAGSLA